MPHSQEVGKQSICRRMRIKRKKINKPSAPLLDELSHELATTITSLMPCQTLAIPQVINLYHIREKIGNM